MCANIRSAAEKQQRRFLQSGFFIYITVLMVTMTASTDLNSISTYWSRHSATQRQSGILYRIYTIMTNNRGVHAWVYGSLATVVLRQERRVLAPSLRIAWIGHRYLSFNHHHCQHVCHHFSHRSIIIVDQASPSATQSSSLLACVHHSSHLSSIIIQSSACLHDIHNGISLRQLHTCSYCNVCLHTPVFVCTTLWTWPCMRLCLRCQATAVIEGSKTSTYISVT